MQPRVKQVKRVKSETIQGFKVQGFKRFNRGISIIRG